MIYKLPCCRSDRSHKTKLYLQMHTKRKVSVWFGLFPVRQFTTGFQKLSLLWFFAGFCHAGKGIAAEHIVRQSSLLSMRIVLMYLPHRKKNCRTGKRIAAEQQLKFHYWAGLFSQWWTFPNWSSDTATRLNLSLGMNCNRLFLNLMLLGKRLIMTGALEVFQCHHHGRMTGDDRETRKRHIFPISASALNCIIVQFDRRYQISMTGAEIEDEAMDVKYCEPGSNWSVVA